MILENYAHTHMKHTHILLAQQQIDSIFFHVLFLPLDGEIVRAKCENV